MSKSPDQKLYSHDEAEEEAAKIREEMEGGEAKDYNEAEKIVEMDKEKEKLPIIFISYRDNDLFREQIPAMVQMLSSMGRNVEIQTFPEGTKEEEIKQWYQDNRSKLEGKELISDRTAEVHWSIREELESTGTRQSGNLDDLISAATKRAIFGEDSKKWNKDGAEYSKGWSEEQSAKFFSTLVRRILENPKNVPQSVYIFLDRILDHTYAVEPEKAKELRVVRESQEKKDAEKLVAEKLKKWLAEGGIDDDKIIMGPELLVNGFNLNVAHISDEGERLIEEADKPGNWIIIDRHNVAFFNKELKSAKFLKLPESNFYRSAREAGFINPKPEDLTESLKEILEEKFSGEKKSK